MTPVVQFTDGGSFGELALLNCKPRAATVRTVKGTHFATLEKDAFNKTTAMAVKKVLREKIRYLKSF